MIFYRSRVWYVLNVVQRGSELIPVYDHAAFVAVVAHLAGDHFHRHANRDRLFANVGQLCGKHGTFFEFYDCHCVRRIRIKTSGGFIHCRVRINLAFAAECKLFLCLVAAIGTYVAGWENFVVAVRANLAYESVSLFLETPVSWDFHF